MEYGEMPANPKILNPNPDQTFSGDLIMNVCKAPVIVKFFRAGIIV